MTTLRLVEQSDVEDLVDLIGRLFADDAGVHDPYADVTWPRRQGQAHYEALVDDRKWLLLLAAQDRRPVGCLVGVLSEPTPTRREVRYGELQSIYVRPDARDGGVGTMLTERFFRWAEDEGCVRTFVSSYWANDGAKRFYRRHGFADQSLTLVRAVDS